MYTKNQIFADLRAAGIASHDTVLVHSSMKALGPVQGGADTVLDVFSEHLQEGLLVMPTHTWEQIDGENSVFDPVTEPSCVGILSELFRQRAGVARSWHPTHSVAALGNEAVSFAAGEEHWDTPLPRQGCWGKLYDRNAKILFLGAPLTTNTILHGVEEWAGVPQRLTDDYQSLMIRKPDGILLDRPMRRHSAPVDDISGNYGKIETPMLELGIARRVKIGDAESVLCQAKPMVDLVFELLRRNPDLFLDSQPIAREWYESRLGERDF